MSKIDEWMRRVREMSAGKSQERVTAFDKDVLMTATQAHRFRELQELGFPEHPPGQEPPPDRDWYPLPEASERLGASVAELLAAAAERRFDCLVEAGPLRGRWEPAPPPGRLTHLALPPAACREIAAFGSANVGELAVPGGGDDAPLFRLGEIQFFDPTRIVIGHPLPDPASLAAPA